MSRSPLFDGVSPSLLNAIKRVGDNYGPYGVRIISAYRPGSGQSQHGHGKAIDVELYDKKTGEKLANYQDSRHAAAYQQFAHAVHDDAAKNDPQLAAKLRWGGYFGNDAATGKPKYGSFDLMHFDEAGHVGMRGGSFKGGFSPEMQKYWKVAALNGGVGAPAGAAPGTAVPDVQAGAGPAAVAAARAADTKATAAPSAAAAKDPNMMKQAFLNTLLRGEAPKGAYSMINGGGKMADLSQMPTGTKAAGQFQFLPSTFAEEAKKYGYKDFQPETQNTAAWNYARDSYTQKTGRRLEDDLASNDPKVLNNISTALAGKWPSLPGGDQPNSNWAGRDFASVYNENLKGSGTATEYPDPTPNVGSGAGDYADPITANSAPADTSVATSDASSAISGKKHDYGKDVGDIFSGFADIMAKGPVAQNAAAKSSPATIAMPTPMPGGISPTVDPRVADAQRQQLAVALQRLNSGRLV
jgi:muramidase (phage lysozyme)